MRLELNLSHHSYELVIDRGGLARTGEWLSSLWTSRKITIITDHHVASHYLDIVKTSLENSDFEVFSYVFKAGEPQKNLSTASDIYRFLAEAGMTRSDGILALGGGVVGDLAGFVASTYMRGLSFVQVPTSLMAQVDASIGGKTGLNTDLAKNMIGTFHQPDGVLIDPDSLRTLGRRELLEGMAEVIKSALILDKSLWELLETMSGGVESVLEMAEDLIYRACRVKSDLVMADEKDQGLRLHLNFGHTIGHALELVSGYGQLMHGEAVAIGMVMVSQLAEEQSLATQGLTDKIRKMCQKFDLPVSYDCNQAGQLYHAIALDKKRRGKKLNLVIVEDVGQAMIYPVSLDVLRKQLEF